MQPLRQVQLTARCVLLWLALFLGVAIASPLVQPQAMQLVCSGSAVSKLVADNGNDNYAKAMAVLHGLDCPLCVGVGAPPPLQTVDLAEMRSRGYDLPLRSCGLLVAPAAEPPPARGPPSFS
jgi:hypothetical protein